MTLIVNDERIDEAVLEQEFASIKSSFEARSGNTCCCSRDDEFREYARQNVVAQVLLTQEARRADKPVPDSEIDAELARLKDEHGGETQFYAALGAAPEAEPQIRQDIALNLSVQKLLDDIVGDTGEPTDAELTGYYERHIEAFTTLEKVRASHILKSSPKSEDREATYNELRAIREQLLTGADFDALAHEHSDKASEAAKAAAEGDNPDDDNGIDLGWFQRGELMDEFEIVAFSLRLDEVSPVFSTPYGLHILKLTERAAPTPKPFDAVRDDVLARFREDQRNEKIQAFVKKSEASATIEHIEDDPDA